MIKLTDEVPYQINLHCGTIPQGQGNELAPTVIQALICNSEEYSARRRREAEIAYYSSQEFFDYADEYAERRWKKKRKKKKAKKLAKRAQKRAKKTKRRDKEVRRAVRQLIKLLEAANG